jgi:hypothetical protein
MADILASMVCDEDKLFRVCLAAVRNADGAEVYVGVNWDASVASLDGSMLECIESTRTGVWSGCAERKAAGLCRKHRKGGENGDEWGLGDRHVEAGCVVLLLWVVTVLCSVRDARDFLEGINFSTFGGRMEE